MKPTLSQRSQRDSRSPIIAIVCVAIICISAVAHGQQNFNGNGYGAVGGVSIDGEGVLSNATVDALGDLRKARLESLERIPVELNQAAETRKISLRRLEATINDCLKNNKPLPDAVKYLAGLQRIRYVFVYPEQKDIVLVGPGEGWKIDAKGAVVGAITGRPVMLLDDLLVALRTAREAAQGGIGCSIDPTADGLARLNQQLPGLIRNDDKQALATGIEKALGIQRISVHGVPATSHFARVLVAADYRMKRLAMDFEPSPVRGLPSYLQMLPATARTVQSPRFWLEPKYEAVLRDPEGLAWEFCGSGVKTMTEEDFLTAAGNVQHSGKAHPLAQKWANIMTDKYAELAVADPIFGELQNCIDLAIVGALVAKERLTEKAGNSLPTLLESPALKPDAFDAPKQVPSQASVLKKGRNWVISASGGVAINSWLVVDKAQPSDKVAPVRAKFVPAGNNWWSN